MCVCVIYMPCLGVFSPAIVASESRGVDCCTAPYCILSIPCLVCPTYLVPPIHLPTSHIPLTPNLTRT